MAKLSAQEIIDSLKEMTLLEIKEVVDLMKEEFGVDPSAVAVAAAPAAGDTADAAPANQDVVLASCGPNKIADEGGVVKEQASSEEAEELKAKFEEAGATIELK